MVSVADRFKHREYDVFDSLQAKLCYLRKSERRRAHEQMNTNSAASNCASTYRKQNQFQRDTEHKTSVI